MKAFTRTAGEDFSGEQKLQLGSYYEGWPEPQLRLTFYKATFFLKKTTPYIVQKENLFSCTDLIKYEFPEVNGQIVLF